ncbi:MAG: hypothetical protein IKQ44_08095 [Lachnospiraceae bacterium]|nr:hypothetical protein [Lachnospiraceae bacterium]
MSERVLDQKGRWRNVTISFRASREESDAIHEAAWLSGLTVQTYIISKLLDREVVVERSPRTYKILKDKMDEIIHELKRIQSSGECSEEFLETIKYVTYIYTGTKEES